jgi:hypothetical protein
LYLAVDGWIQKDISHRVKTNSNLGQESFLYYPLKQARVGDF